MPALETKAKELIFNTLSQSWAKSKHRRVVYHLKANDKILDIGAGKGALSWMLLEQGFDVTPVDVQNISFTEKVKPVIYDGETLPFPDNSRDVGLFLTVLHHTPDPEALIREALRVCDRLIIIEDVYHGKAQKYATWFTDSLFNLEFKGHPHTNKNNFGWLKTFADLDLRVLHIEKEPVLGLFEQVTYYVTK
ncbi:class I SAM-dependent methyltransferase [Salisediminibacterium selenitireducens]|uniref:Methyltransferase type 11 n=1 Tax=Bacillus selenitireducens (strain ATCC 700615 / DSM 15326 / MLS10) TaxID=439292 RepID=D6XWR1_BACIE|nr:class I SAM-dependent methyltransferase [Salisediminibacterium selenitireducens]ADH97903.1 Methyltransferase type 11 [[Bacillus] selenitireducens MLS10]